MGYFPEMEDMFYNRRFLGEVQSYWNAPYAKPTMMLFNICGPHQRGSAPPRRDDVPGRAYENSPVWLQNIMGKSGLFTDYMVKMAQVIAWWYMGETGGFTYWPDGPLEPPQDLAHADVEQRRRGPERARCSIAATRSGRPEERDDRGSEAPIACSSSDADDDALGRSRPTAT